MTSSKSDYCGYGAPNRFVRVYICYFCLLVFLHCPLGPYFSCPSAHLPIVLLCQMTVRIPSAIGSSVPEQFFLQAIRTRLYQASYLLPNIIVFRVPSIISYALIYGMHSVSILQVATKTCRHLPKQKLFQVLCSVGTSEQLRNSTVLSQKEIEPLHSTLRGKKTELYGHKLDCHLVLTAQKSPQTGLFACIYHEDIALVTSELG